MSPPTPSQPPSQRRRRLLAVIVAGLVLVTVELLAYGVIAALEQSTRFQFPRLANRLRDTAHEARKLLDSQDRTLTRLDAELGWIYAPKHRTGPYSSNSRGARGRREYADRPAPGVLRIAAFGNSFVHANEVGDAEAWPARVEARARDVEVLNFGVGGYGQDQALLLARRQLPGLGPQLVILGFTEVDLARNVNRFRRFRDVHTLPLSKPRFLLGPRGLRLLPNPFPGAEGLQRIVAEPRLSLEAAPHDFFFEPLEWRNPAYDLSASLRLLSTLGARAWRRWLDEDRLYRRGAFNPDSEAFRVLVGIVRQLAEEVRAPGREFLLLVFPARDSDIWGEGRVYEPLLAELEDLRILDLAPALAADPALSPATLRAPGGHYSALANDSVARALLAELSRQGLYPRQR